MTTPVPKSRYTGPAATDIVRGVGVAAYNALVDAGCAENVKRLCFLVPGEIAWDECQCGQLAQTISSVVPSESPPTPAVDVRSSACGPGAVVVNVTLSLTRCVTGVDDDGNAPSCEDLDDEAVLLETDRWLVRRAVACHLEVLRRAYTVFSYGVNAATSVGPQGGCAGIQLTYWLSLSDDCCPQ